MENILTNLDMTIVTALIILLVTGYFIYKIITSPFKSFRFIAKGIFILALGCVVWFGIFYLLIYSS